jgi:hypothetical protein
MFGGDDMADNETRLTAPFPTAVETPKAETCRNCRWWLGEEHGFGLCVRYPQAEPKAAADFCGEFKAKR